MTWRRLILVAAVAAQFNFPTLAARASTEAPARADDAEIESLFGRGRSCHWDWSQSLRRPTRYCVYRSKAARESTGGAQVLYFLHGFFKTEEQFFRDGYDDALEKVAGEKRLVVVIPGGGLWSWYTDWDEKARGFNAYETWLLNEFMPAVETKFSLCRTRGCRRIAGPSMGGYGALKLALRHSAIFSRAGANSPTLAPFNIYSADPQWDLYFERTKVGAVWQRALLRHLRNVFRDSEHFDLHDPSVLAVNSRDAASRFPALYFDVGGADEYGFVNGFTRLEIGLRARGRPFESHFDVGRPHKADAKAKERLLRFMLR